MRATGRWIVPLILRLQSGLTLDDVRSVLTAVTNQHDVLRLQIVERAGIWQQHIAAPQEFTQLSIRSLPQDVAAGSPAERDAILAILAEIVTGRDPSQTPLTAAYIAGAHDGRCYLAIAMHHLAGDRMSCEILTSDIFTACGQRLAGAEIALQPVTMTWSEWSQRCAALATHPAVMASRDFWLDNSKKVTSRVVDHDAAEQPRANDLARLSAPLTTMLTWELDGAQRVLGLATDEILLAALGRTIARTIGEGVVAVDLAGDGRSVLGPEVELQRTVGWLTTIYPVPLACASPHRASATTMLATVHRTLAAVPNRGISYGLLRYLHAPTALQFAAQPPSDIFFSYVGTVPELSSGEGPVQFDIDTAVRETLPGLGHALQLRVYRTAGLLHLDWWYDRRRFDRSTVEELAEQFPLALIELTSEAIPPIAGTIESAIGGQTFTLVDSSTLDIASVAGSG